MANLFGKTKPAKTAAPMNPIEKILSQELARLRTNPIPEREKERARYRALSAFRSAKNATIPQKSSSFLWAVSLAAAAIIVVGVLTATLHSPILPKSDKNSAFFSEIEKLFAGRLVAAIREGDSLSFELSGARTELPADQRIVLTFRKNGQLIEVYTYSGREVCLDLNGSQVCATPLIRSDGSVMLVTNAAVLEGSASSEIKGFQVSMDRLQKTSS